MHETTWPKFDRPQTHRALQHEGLQPRTVRAGAVLTVAGVEAQQQGLLAGDGVAAEHTHGQVFEIETLE